MKAASSFRARLKMKQAQPQPQPEPLPLVPSRRSRQSNRETLEGPSLSLPPGSHRVKGTTYNQEQRPHWDGKSLPSLTKPGADKKILKTCEKKASDLMKKRERQKLNEIQREL